MEASRDPEAVRSMFDRIASRYDLANHLLSGGVDFIWRWRAAELVRQWQPLAIARKLPNAEIIGADFSEQMLAIARSKGLARTVAADALQLPFGDQSFDYVTVAFGLRNMADWGAALREIGAKLGQKRGTFAPKLASSDASSKRMRSMRRACGTTRGSAVSMPSTSVQISIASACKAAPSSDAL